MTTTVFKFLERAIWAFVCFLVESQYPHSHRRPSTNIFTYHIKPILFVSHLYCGYRLAAYRTPGKPLRRRDDLLRNSLNTLTSGFNFLLTSPFDLSL
ncbi:hypothetical protein K469DRAFT_717298 [Zopfia rhizophila CBS 207.26]|uniref:Secreted protein n=1 Tax=Zopfia rhizophila CBS 207.26 TaxID=1314779 RepID=A0A6A6ENX1_9PEZI|nr:hypothetical protein K469DRAFT_717298 [Zopfia rhizophila CBS 207.26]